MNPRSLANLRPGPKWKGGQSGNPAGLPADIEKAKRYIRKKMTRKLADTLLAIAMDPAISGQDRVRAAELLLHYALGRPASAPEDLAAKAARPLGGGTTVNVAAMVPGLAGLTNEQKFLLMLKGELPPDPREFLPAKPAE
jgi:hypothetical protein